MLDTKTAIETFREMEYAKYLLKKSERDLERLLAFGNVDKDEYDRQADKIRTGFAAKLG
jgi:hypothetical protein